MANGWLNVKDKRPSSRAQSAATVKIVPAAPGTVNVRIETARLSINLHISRDELFELAAAQIHTDES